MKNDDMLKKDSLKIQQTLLYKSENTNEFRFYHKDGKDTSLTYPGKNMIDEPLKDLTVKKKKYHGPFKIKFENYVKPFTKYKFIYKIQTKILFYNLNYKH